MNAEMTVARDLRVLVLDDEAHRHEWFARQATELGWGMIHAWSAQEAIHTLERTARFDVVFLDFDLAVLTADRQRQDDMWITGPNGGVAARFLAHVLPLGKRPAAVHIHSWNPRGGDEMEALLKVAGLNVSRRAFGDFRFVARAREREELAS